MEKHAWRSAAPEVVEAACAEADGPRIGLPAVETSILHRVLDYATSHPASAWEEAKTLALASTLSRECGRDRTQMTASQLAEHDWTPDGYLLRDCQGYHTTLLRAIRNNMHIARIID